MNIKRYILPAIASVLVSSGMTSCLGDNDNTYDYSSWKNENETYLAEKEAETDGNGKKIFQKIIPDWCPGEYILAQWHNDRSLTASNLVPMDNSTVEVKFDASYINGTVIDNSAWAHSGSSWRVSDSTYICKPNSSIVGFWAMLTNMHVGDSVTCIIPTGAAYGTSSSSVMPYSTLIYHMKLKAISAYEVSGK